MHVPIYHDKVETVFHHKHEKNKDCPGCQQNIESQIQSSIEELQAALKIMNEQGYQTKEVPEETHIPQLQNRAERRADQKKSRKRGKGFTKSK